MVKLTEITQAPTEYDPKSKTVNKSYMLRDMYINPSFIVSMTVNTALALESSNQELVPGLNKDISFVNIILGTSSGGVKQISVVGTPDSVLEKLGE